MAFEPLQTDEKLDVPVQAARDMDTHMLIGCSGFVAAAVGGYVLGVWPFFAIQDTFVFERLVLAASLGFIPQAVLGLVAVRRFGIAGASGLIGGSLCVGIFMFLRLQQLFISARLQQSPTPNFPESFVYMLPLTEFLVALFLGILFLPKRELSFDQGEDSHK